MPPPFVSADNKIIFQTAVTDRVTKQSFIYTVRVTKAATRVHWRWLRGKICIRIAPMHFILVLSRVANPECAACLPTTNSDQHENMTGTCSILLNSVRASCNCGSQDTSP